MFELLLMREALRGVEACFTPCANDPVTGEEGEGAIYGDIRQLRRKWD